MIQNIRNNFSWLLIILVGLGLFGFLLMDMVSGQTSIFGGGQTTLGAIGDRKVNVQDFERNFNTMESVLYRGANGGSLGRRAQFWNYYVEDAILQEEAEELGLGVSTDELSELTFGPNYSSIIRQRFPNQQAPGQVDGASVRSTFDAISNPSADAPVDPNFVNYWKFQEKEIMKDRVQVKLTNLVSKAMYTPTWMAEMLGQEQSQRIDFAYVQVPFDAIPTTDISLEEADYANYLSANAGRYRQDEETRNAEYVVFNVDPTSADTAKVRAAVADLKENFRTAEDDALFVQNNYGSMANAFVQEDVLNNEIKNFAFNQPVGSVYGPYQENGAFKLAKIVDRRVIADSVRARHILLPVDPSDPQGGQGVMAQANTYKSQIESGQERFDSLAVRYSTDAGSGAKGGDLGFFAPGRMVAPFNDAVFYEMTGDEIKIVPSQFGVHIIQVTDRKFLENTESVKMAYVSQNIIPSSETEKAVEDRALSIMENNRTLTELRKAVAANSDLELETATSIKRNDFAFSTLGSDQETRDMVKFLYSADANAVSPTLYRFTDPVDYYTNKYVISALESTQEAGVPRWQSVRNQIEPLVMNEKRAAMIKQQVTGNNDLTAIANKYSVEVDTALGASFGTGFIPSIGNEPKVVSTAFGGELNTLSAPIVGANGVYIVKRLSNPDEATTPNVATIRSNQNNTARSAARVGLLPALRKNADVEDNRANFF